MKLCVPINVAVNILYYSTVLKKVGALRVSHSVRYEHGDGAVGVLHSRMHVM